MNSARSTKLMDAMAATATDAEFARLGAQFEGVQADTMWSQLHAQYRMAQVARDAMRDRDATMVQRDFAAATYGRHCDRLMDLLERMSEQQVLVQIGTLLSKRGR